LVEKTTDRPVQQFRTAGLAPDGSQIACHATRAHEKFREFRRLEEFFFGRDI